MKSSQRAPLRRFFTTIAGDAFLFSAALFAICMGLSGAVVMLVPGLFGPEGPVGVLGAIISGTSSLLGLASMVTGAVVAWRLHGRDFSGAAFAGIALGIVLAFVAGAAVFLAFVGVAMALGAVVGEIPGLIVALAILAVALLVIMVRLDVDAVRDLAPGRSVHRRVDILRLTATGVLVAFAVAVALAVRMQPNSEVGEAILFAVMAGAFSGMVTAFADAWVRRAQAKHADANAIAGA